MFGDGRRQCTTQGLIARPQMKAPDSDALRFAAEWLRQYDDTHDGGGDTMRAAAVADWLDAQADAADLRAAARQHHVPVEKLRRALQRRDGSASLGAPGGSANGGCDGT